jgi:hypothetical protein
MIKIRMIDSVCYANWHLQFNTKLLTILSNIAPVVEYRGGQNIGQNRPNIKRKKVYVVRGTTRWSGILRFSYTILNDVWQLLICPYNTIIVYSFDATVSVRMVNALNKVLHKRIIMFRHGSMEMLQTNTANKGIFYWFENKLTRQFFLNPKVKITDRLHFFVLGDVILKNLSNLLSIDKIKQFHSIDHPYNFDENVIAKKIDRNLKLQIGTVGVFSEYKGGSYLLQLVEILKEKGLDKVNVSVTGKIDYDLRFLQRAGIDLPANEGKNMVSNEEMNLRIDRLDFILYFYPSTTYQLTASGAIFDAINRKRPIIALRNDYFEYIFSKFGAIGYLVDSISEMANIIYRISNGTEQVINYDFEGIQNLFSERNITKDIDTELKKIGFIV